MSRYSFEVKDYRILRDAKLEPEGITLLYGKNGSGKSTIIKSLVSFLSNRHLDDNFRHGQTSYSIKSRVGENTLEYDRAGDKSSLRFNDEVPRSKLGQGPMYQVEPRFPLKRIDYDSDSFYPNFAAQNSVPVFGDIEITSFFASIYADVAKVSGRVTELKRACADAGKVKNDSQVNGDMLKGKVSEAHKGVATVQAQFPDLESQYYALSELARKRNSYVKFMTEFSDLSQRCTDSTKKMLVSCYKDAQPLFKDLVFVQKVKGLLEQADILRAKLVKVVDELFPLQEIFPEDLVSLVGGVGKLSGLQLQLGQVRGEFGTLPDVSVSLMEKVQSLRVLEQALGVARIEWGTCEGEYNVVQEQLKNFPCDRFLAGLCPYQEQIKV